MPHDHFIVPNNVSVSQALSLLYSIVSIQLDNYRDWRTASLSEDTSEKLVSVLVYIREGLVTIKRKFGIAHYQELKEPDEIRKYADIRILGQDIKECLARMETRYEERHGSDWRARLRMKFTRSRDKGEQERTLKEKEQVEVLRKQRDQLIREEQKRKEDKERKKEQAIEKQVREEVREEFRKQKEEHDANQHVPRISHRRELSPELVAVGAPSRRSMEQLTRKTEVFGRRSLDGHGRRKSHQYVDSQLTGGSTSSQVNQAALLAWESQSGPKPTQQKARARPKAQQSYNYTKPVIRRPVIRSPVRTSPKVPVVAGFEQPVDRRERDVSSPVLGPKSNNKRNQAPPSKQQGTVDTVDKLSPFERKLHDVMENLEGVDESACQQIINDILITDEKVYWEDISGLVSAKNALKETVVYPFLRPDLFQGLREPVSGILLFGPPGTGKTMLANAVATESKSTFFSISASSVLSKFLGESEKLVRALFYLSKKLAPSIIFIDEVDSLLTSRSDNENESSRRIKTEFLIRWSSLSSATASEKTEEQMENSRVLVLAATNTPWDLDEAARRRFSKRIYIPLPDFETRHYHLKRLMAVQRNKLTESQFNEIAKITEGYSGSDLTSLAKDAAMEPIRDLGEKLIDVNLDLVRAVTIEDFNMAITRVKRSVSTESLTRYEQWAVTYGST